MTSTARAHCTNVRLGPARVRCDAGRARGMYMYSASACCVLLEKYGHTYIHVRTPKTLRKAVQYKSFSLQRQEAALLRWGKREWSSSCLPLTYNL